MLRIWTNLNFSLNLLTSKGDSSDPGNVDLMNLVLSKFRSYLETKEVMKSFKPEYPISQKIYYSYMKLAK